MPFSALPGFGFGTRNRKSIFISRIFTPTSSRLFVKLKEGYEFMIQLARKIRCITMFMTLCEWSFY